MVHGGAQARIVHAEQWDDLEAAEAARSFPILVAAAFYVATTAQLEKLRDYAAAQTIEVGMADMSENFRAKGGEIYLKKEEA